MYKPNANHISKNKRDIKKILKENVEHKEVYLGPHSKSSVTESKFEEQCTKYFERYSERLAQQSPLILPGKVAFNGSKNLEKLTPARRYWCEETNNTSTGIKGLVLQSISILKHLYWHGFNESMTKQYLQIDNISEELSTVVCNPMVSAVLLLHKAKSENLATDIASALNYLKYLFCCFTMY